MTEAQLDNVLMHQKDRMWRHINADSPNFDQILVQFGIVFELWCEAGYEYKAIEQITAILKKISEQLENLHHAASKQREILHNFQGCFYQLQERFYESKYRRQNARPRLNAMGVQMVG